MVTPNDGLITTFAPKLNGTLAKLFVFSAGGSSI